jgi:hypothetical protein
MDISQIVTALENVGVKFAEGVSDADKSQIVSDLFTALGLTGNNATLENFLSLASRAGEVIIGAIKVIAPGDARILLPLSAAEAALNTVLKDLPDFTTKLNELHSMVSDIHGIFADFAAQAVAAGGSTGAAPANSLGASILKFIGVKAGS